MERDVVHLANSRSPVYIVKATLPKNIKKKKKTKKLVRWKTSRYFLQWNMWCQFATYFTSFFFSKFWLRVTPFSMRFVVMMNGNLLCIDIYAFTFPFQVWLIGIFFFFFLNTRFRFRNKWLAGSVWILRNLSKKKISVLHKARFVLKRESDTFHPIIKIKWLVAVAWNDWFYSHIIGIWNLALLKIENIFSHGRGDLE